MSELKMKLPSSLKELMQYLQLSDANTYLLSGGTDLIIRLRKNKIYTGTIIDLSGITELKYITEQKDFIRIGANTTFTEIAESKVLKENCCCLVEAAAQVGSLQIRNSATIGGNIANASPGADSIPALMAMGASVTIMNDNGNHIEKAINEVMLGPGRSCLKPNEVITEIAVPVLDKWQSTFGKIGTRSTVTIARINMAAAIKYDSTYKRIEDARIALGALAPKAFTSIIAEKALIGKRPSGELLAAFQSALVEQVDNSIAGRSSLPYKREAIRGLAQDIYFRLFKA